MSTGDECWRCGHPQRQHDDGGCMYPRWDKSSGLTCFCEEAPEDFEELRADTEPTSASGDYVAGGES